MRMAKRSMAMMMSAGTRKVRMYSPEPANNGKSLSSVGSAKGTKYCNAENKVTR